jgi:ketosteroid isomerase-like protein
MITQKFAQQFATEWIAAWNAHDLPRILSHYTEDFEMSSPFIYRIVNESSGMLKGKEAIGAYWQKALNNMPDLRFELIDVVFGIDSICIYYHSVLNLRAVEWFWFNADLKVKKAMGQYHQIP